MIQRIANELDNLYEVDETAWLEATAELIRTEQWDQVDPGTLAEYLADMARRDRREVSSRLAVLIAHLLKWRFQPDKRSGSWRETAERERQELVELLESGTLRNHAEEVLIKAYRNGVKLAIAETGLPASTFPKECSYTLDRLLAETCGEEQ